MKCFILAAGYGKRMGDLTTNLPKPLLPYRGKTLLDYSIEFAANLGINEFVINTHYYAEKIQDHLRKYSEYKIHISEESEILGTGGGIKSGIQGIMRDDEYFLTLNPDVLLRADSQKLKESIYSYSGDCLLFLSRMEAGDIYTTLGLRDGKVSFQSGDFFYIGMSIINSNILKDIPENTFYDLSEIFRTLSKENHLDGIQFLGEAIDLGDREKYLKLTKQD
jgi:MurNAc alpha-1-phosphate uridylyltransferase